MRLNQEEQAIKGGERGEAARFSLALLERLGDSMGAERFEPIEAAYVNTSFSEAPSHLDFLDFVAGAEGQVAVPTYTNVGGWDQRNPDIRLGERGEQAEHDTHHLMDRHQEIGVELLMTCAPYQLPTAPKFGAQIVCSESNAVSYFNSVVGARTAKYGDYVDLAAALVGRVPYCGLHCTENRYADLLVSVEQLPDELAQEDLMFQLIGHVTGRKAGSNIPALLGLPANTKPENLRSICASAASSGGVAMFHAIGITPEAPSIDAAIGGNDPRQVEVTMKDLMQARAELSQFEHGPIDAVTFGTPHASLLEVELMANALDDRSIAAGVTVYLQLNRFIYQVAKVRGLVEQLERAGVTLVTDTCLYWRPATRGLSGKVMTTSGKFSYYAPGELNVQCRIASLKECVESAVLGRVWQDPVWRDPVWKNTVS